MAKVSEGKKEAVKTYIEQTKLLVTLASAFLIAPAGLVAVLKEKGAVGLTTTRLILFVSSELFFVVSVLAGYIVLATIAGYQDANKFDVYRTATRWASLVQIFAYIAGIGLFIFLALSLI